MTNTKGTVEVEHPNKRKLNTRRTQRVAIKDESILRAKQRLAKVEGLDLDLRSGENILDLPLAKELKDRLRELVIEGLEVDHGRDPTTGDHLTIGYEGLLRGEVVDPHLIREEDVDPLRGDPGRAAPGPDGNVDQGRIVAGGVRGHTDTEISPLLLGSFRLYYL